MGHWEVARTRRLGESRRHGLEEVVVWIVIFDSCQCFLISLFVEMQPVGVLGRGMPFVVRKLLPVKVCYV